MQVFDEVELKLSTHQMYEKGGASNVIACLISILESQLVIINSLKEILDKEAKNGRQ